MIIYALSNDHGDHTAFGGRTAPSSSSSHSPDDTQTINVLRVNTIEWLANNIKARVDGFRSGTSRPDTKIWLLRISAHGNAGYMTIGNGLNRTTAQQFSVLADGYFDEKGRGIELWGCSVASADVIETFPFDRDFNDDGIFESWSLERADASQDYQTALAAVTQRLVPRRGLSYPDVLRGSRERSGSVVDGDGYRMMVALAQAANTKVTAAYDIQIPELDGLDWEWDGAGLLTVFPDGDYDKSPLV